MAWPKVRLDACIEEVTVDAYGEHEQLEAFACVIDELVKKPARASIVSEPVELLGVDAGGELLGLRARCRRHGRVWKVALVDVTLAPDADPELALTVAAYRRWLGTGIG